MPALLVRISCLRLNGEYAWPEMDGGQAGSKGQARERAARAKERELAAHLQAVQLHEHAAEAQERLGRDDRAQAARERAQHAQALYEQALVEQARAGHLQPL
jgi:hypothetical protein